MKEQNRYKKEALFPLRSSLLTIGSKTPSLILRATKLDIEKILPHVMCTFARAKRAPQITCGKNALF